MKKNLLIFCCIAYFAFVQYGKAQQRPELYIGGGLITEDKGTSFSTAHGGLLGFYVPFLSKSFYSIGIDLGGGYYSSDRLKGALMVPYSFPGMEESHVAVDSTLSTAQRMLRVGMGPRADFRLGEKWRLSAALEGGLSMLRNEPYAIDQYFIAGKHVYKKRIYSREKIDDKVFHIVPKVRMSYPLTDNLRLWAEGNYSFSNFQLDEQHVVTTDGEGRTFREWGQFVEAGYTSSSSRNSLESFGAQVGLSLQLGRRKSETKVKAVPAERVPRVVASPKAGEETVKREKRSLLPLLPKNNSRFDSEQQLKSLNWTMIGPTLSSPQYSISLEQLDNRHKSRRAYHAQTSKMEIGIHELTKGIALADGQYRWQVKELGTGLTTNVQFFSVGSCELSFEIEEETISCMGYVGENRKYQICFNSVYASTSGDLTYSNVGSGLTVYDQNNTVLNYTLVAPQTTLVSQSGSASSTVQYCFEVEVAPDVTAIGIGLQGDDLDPGPILCQPGVSIVIDSLPDCICQDCDDLELSFDPVQISSVSASTHAFSFEGDIQVNQPIYAMEIQVLSYQYAADPAPCSGGVSVLEEAGMLLRNGTTINNSNQLNFYTSASASGANPNAAKAIRYMPESALSGSIPIHLVMGLPGPAPGFDADCCSIKYEVCFRIVVYYDPESCKSCVFTKCFQFTN